jgi:hypothetical protein
MLMMAAGCEDGNDADSLRIDPLFKLASSPGCGCAISQTANSRVCSLTGLASSGTHP